jgi:hypothetical protein
VVEISLITADYVNRNKCSWYATSTILAGPPRQRPTEAHRLFTKVHRVIVRIEI